MVRGGQLASVVTQAGASFGLSSLWSWFGSAGVGGDAPSSPKPRIKGAVVPRSPVSRYGGGEWPAWVPNRPWKPPLLMKRGTAARRGNGSRHLYESHSLATPRSMMSRRALDVHLGLAMSQLDDPLHESPLVRRGLPPSAQAQASQREYEQYMATAFGEERTRFMGGNGRS